MRAADRVGSVVAGKYRLDALLGEGGMGAVFQATHLTVGKRFAIKLLHAEVSKNPDAKRRFTQEAQAASRIGHPGILDVYDLGEAEDGGLYMVMELLVGESLAERVSRGQLGIQESVRHAISMLTALEAAHGASIIHRDIKPANVFLVKTGGGTTSLRVLDFGIAKFQEPLDGARTNTGAVLGSPYYMAPEQVRAEKEIDARADVWAVGATLYELLVGEPAHVAPTHAAVIAKIVMTPAPLVSVRRPEVDEHLDGIVARALAIDPEMRWVSAADMRLALETYLAGNATTLMSDRPASPAASGDHREALAFQPPSGNRARSGNGETPRAVVADATTDKTRGREGLSFGKLAVSAIALGALVTVGVLLSKSSNRGAAPAGAAATTEPIAAPTPSVSVPAVVASGINVPAVEIASVNVPSVNVPGVSVPSVNVPSVNVPSVNVPSFKVPAVPTSKTYSPTRACPPGEAPTSGGHCCPIGLTWQAGRCERDIATKPPF
jgi:serine/threonine-protein kinase